MHSNLFFTHEKCTSVEEAKAKTITEVKDGDPLWMFVQLDQPLKNYAFTDDIIKQSNPAEPYMIVISIGPDHDRETEWGEEEIYFNKAELENNFFTLNLAPGMPGRNQSSDVFINLIANGSPGVWTNSIRIYAPTNEREETDFGSKPKRIYLAEAPITADVSDGIDNYYDQKNNYQYVKERGTAEENKIPSEGKFVDTNIKEMMLDAVRNKNIEPLKFYFTSDDWTVQANWSSGLPEWQSVFAAVLYKDGDECKFAEVGVSYKYIPLTEQWSDLYDPVVKEGFPIDCSKLIL